LTWKDRASGGAKLEEQKFSKRWRYYIDRQFQNQFMLRFSVVVVLVAVLTLGVLFLVRENAFNLLPEGGLLFPVKDTVECVAPDGQKSPAVIPGKPYNAFELFWQPILIISLANLLLIVVFSLFYSHSMAGPIYSIKKSLEGLRDGSPVAPIRIRKGDQFQELVELLNQVIEKRVK